MQLAYLNSVAIVAQGLGRCPKETLSSEDANLDTTRDRSVDADQNLFLEGALRNLKKAGRKLRPH
jgi:hypothetical protein